MVLTRLIVADFIFASLLLLPEASSSTQQRFMAFVVPFLLPIYASASIFVQINGTNWASWSRSFSYTFWLILPPPSALGLVVAEDLSRCR